MDSNTLSLDGVQYDGFTLLHSHNLYGTMQTAKTHNYFATDSKSERGFTISRSGSQGIGRYGARMLGNNFSTFDYLKSSIISIF
jgi:alpha-glucosidase